MRRRGTCIAPPPPARPPPQVVRKGGLRSTLLYNLLGAGEWEVLMMDAVIGSGAGGLPLAMSLLEMEERLPQAGGHCQPHAPQPQPGT